MEDLDLEKIPDNLSLTPPHELPDKQAELIKLRIGLFKHMATVSSGAIVVAAAFIRDLPAGAPTGVLATGLVSFIATILLSLWSSFYAIGYLMSYREAEATADYSKFGHIHQGRWIWVSPLATFFISMMSFAWFFFSSLS